MALAVSTLNAIRMKVRRLTRSPSESQISTADIDQYVNTFVSLDFPEHLRLFSLQTTFTFVTNPYQDAYPTNTVAFGGNTTNPLYDFQNRYITVQPPVYIAGYEQFYTQSREQFFRLYPKVNSIQNTGLTGDGITTTFTGTIPPGYATPPLPNQVETAILQNNVLISSIDINLQGLSLVDIPVVNPVNGYNTVNGNLYVPGQLPLTPPTSINPNNTVNYATGVFTATFNTPPNTGYPINAQTVFVPLTLPQSLLYYDNTFFVRPVPDQAYRVQIECFLRPTQLLSGGDVPQLNEWWQYIAYGAAKKVFEDRMDLDSVQLIFPEFHKQELLVQRRTIVQQTNERVATIYTEQTNFGPNWGSFGWGGGPGPG